MIDNGPQAFHDAGKWYTLARYLYDNFNCFSTAGVYFSQIRSKVVHSYNGNVSPDAVELRRILDNERGSRSVYKRIREELEKGFTEAALDSGSRDPKRFKPPKERLEQAHVCSIVDIAVEVNTIEAYNQMTRMTFSYFLAARASDLKSVGLSPWKAVFDHELGCVSLEVYRYVMTIELCWWAVCEQIVIIMSIIRW